MGLLTYANLLAGRIPAGTAFQKRVWDIMRTIEFGSVLSYKEISARLGNHHLARAVGGAANKNPIPIIIPCHRVVAADGPGGFSGSPSPGLKTRMLLSVHDEIVFEVPPDEQETVVSLVRDVMENVWDLSVPLKVNLQSGDNWATAH